MSKKNQSTKENAPHQPYTRFFEYSFSRIDIINDFVKQIFPKKLSKKIIQGSIQPRKDSFVQPNMNRLFSDLIFDAKFGKNKNDIWISILFDHKSEPDNHVYIQLAKYMNSIWEAQRTDKEIPKVVIPVIFYHGEKRWNVKKFEAMFKQELDEDLLRFLPSFEFVLIDLDNFSDEQILKLESGFLINTLLAFKHYKDEDYIRENFSFFVRKYPDANDPNFNEAILAFLFRITEIKSEEMTILIEISEKILNQDIMSTYHVLLEKYSEIGKKNNKIEMILSFANQGVSISIIAEAAKTTEDYVQKVIAGEIKPESIIPMRPNNNKDV